MSKKDDIRQAKAMAQWGLTVSLYALLVVACLVLDHNATTSTASDEGKATTPRPSNGS